MLNFISLIIFLHVIPRAFSMESILRLAFLNYQNIIRCDDTQIQYYYGSIETPALLRVHLKCDSKDDIFDNYYHGYVWDTIELECSSDKQYVHERISIIWKLRGLVADIYKLPDPIARILNSNELYNLTRMREKENSIVFQSNEQLVENLFGNPQKRNIFLSFPNYPIMCCLSYDIKPDWSCDNEPVQIIDKTIICYYNPTDNKEPSVEQWLAEVRQFMDAERPKDKDSYVLNLPKPTITDDNKQDQSSNIDNIIDGQRIPNVDPYKKADDKKKKQSPMKKAFVVIIIIALSIVALLAIIGGVLFVLLKKKNKESSLPSEQLEKGDSNTSSSTVAESVKSSENDEIKTKQNIAAQKTDPNKRKRRESLLQFAFTNGVNLIRCSDNELQYYYAPTATSVELFSIVDCKNPQNIIASDYASFGWLEFTLECSSDNKYVNEKITIAKRNEMAQQKKFELPIPETKSLNPNVPYTLKVTNDDLMSLIFESSDLPADKNFALDKHRSVFLWFSNHPVICKLSYKISDETLCDGNPPTIEDDEIRCYYDLVGNKKPSINQFTAEFRQLNSVDHPDEDYFLLNLPKPGNNRIDDSSDLDDDASESTRKNRPKSNGNKPSASNQPKKAKKHPNAFAIIISLIIALVVITIIGTVAFFLFKKKKQSSSSSTPGEQLEKVVSISSQSEVSMDDEKVESNIQSNPTKQTRAAATMNFTDDE